MPRAVDLQLLALAVVVGASVGQAGLARSGHRGVGAPAVAVALLLAWVADRRWLGAVPTDLGDGPGPWVAGAAVAAAVGWGSARLPVVPTAGLPPVLPLGLASLAGVWVSVPETSVCVLVAGVLLGVAAVLAIGGRSVTRPAAVVVGVAPVVAAVAGAAGEPHALVGGLLCSATLAALAAGRAVRSVPKDALVLGTALHLAAALVAARQVGVARDWGGAVPAIAVSLGLSVAAAAALRRDQAPAS